jgi:adenosylmethionine-8-amino-7-oxononanoate aminotransferase
MAVKKYKGLPYHLWNPFSNVEEILSIMDIGPMMIVRGEGPYVFNERGDKFINCMSGLWNVAVGHGRQELVDAACEQMRTLAFASCFRQAHPVAMALAEKLVQVSGGHYQRVYLGTNGSEAVETAIKMARQYHRQGPEKSRYKIISLKNSYHGVSYGAMSTSGLAEEREKFGPLPPGFVQIDPPYCYRCPYGQTDYPSCSLVCAEALDKAIAAERPAEVAAFIMEPVMGAYGMIPPPDAYYRSVGETCKKHGVLFIADEVTTGFGRTGRLFVSESWDIRPDILALGKAISSGYLPMSACLATEAVYERFKGKGNQFEHGSTNSGHPVCSAVALANIDIIINEGLAENAHQVGEHLISKLLELKDKHSAIGDVRGRGLMIGVELVKDKKTKEPLSEKAAFDTVVDLATMGLLCYFRQGTIGLLPPLIIDEKIADDIVEIADRAFATGLKAGLAKKARLAKEVSRAKLKK